MSDEIGKMIAMALLNSGSNFECDKQTQLEMLLKFKEHMNSPIPELKVGDVVVRNKWGEERYNQPESNRLAMIISVFEEPQIDEDGRVVHGEMAIVVKTKTGNFTCITHTIDFRYYQKAGQIEKLKKKGGLRLVDDE